MASVPPPSSSIVDNDERDRARRAIAAVETSPYGIVNVDHTARIVAANAAAVAMLGDPDGLIGRSWTDVTGAGAAIAHLDITTAATDGTAERTIYLVERPRQNPDVSRQLAAADRYRAIVQRSIHTLILCANDPRDSAVLSGRSVLGYPMLTPLPGGMLSLCHPDDIDRAVVFMTGVRDGDPHHTDTIELRLRTADGRWRTCEVGAENLTHEPSVGGVVVWAVDVTDRRAKERRAEASLLRLHLLIDNLGAAVLMEDEDRRVLVANDEMVQMFAIPVPPQDLVGTDCSGAAETVKQMFADPDGFIAGVARCLEGRQPVIGEQLVLADGRVWERDYLPIPGDAGPVGHLWRYRDVTRHIEETRLLADQNRSLEELARLKNEFVARASHELRSPLTSVVSFADLLAETTKGQLDDEQTEYLAVIVRNAQRLLRLIDDLLLVAKLESNTLPLSLGLVDLPTLVTQVSDELRPRAESKQLRLDVGTTPGGRLRADALRLQQMTSNLIGNAIAYTPAGGTITVAVRPAPGGAGWELTVGDTGVGIGAGDLPELFAPFFRAASGARVQAAGTGLGLVIVRSIVDAHHGTIAVDSEEGRGTTITVRLPFGDTG
ncbi:MAG: ATP-binding protein [Desertimonas sp.]